MALLLYKSNEMFSSTELIRKSKTIFNKIIDNEIDKAVIMRDGKPGFLLMDFQKYESIMQEFEDLKAKFNNNPTTQKTDIKTVKEPIIEPRNKTIEKITQKPIDEEKIEDISVDIEEDEDNTTIETENKIEHLEDEPQKTKPAHVVPPRPKMIVEESTIPNDDNEEMIEDQQEESEPVQKEEIYEEPSEEEEINTAIERIKSMNFNDDMRKLAEAKIKEKILKARKERAKLREQEELLNKQDLKEELELQVQIKEKNKKKERELREFWD